MPLPKPKYPVRPKDPDGPEPNASVTSEPFRDPASLRSEQPGFVLLGEVPSEYPPGRFPEDSLRSKFLRGFLAGSVLSALAIAALFFVYRGRFSDAVTHLAASVGAKPATENVPVPATQSAAPAPSLSPATAEAAPPLTASADSQTAANTTAANATTPPSADPGSRQPPAVADPVADFPAAETNLGRTSEPPEPILNGSKTLANRSRAPAPVEPSDDTGDQDLAIAQRYLRNGGPSADSAAAALLWSAVKKGNVPAEVALAELYARGEGVARSCEQARVLLYAAAGKGSDEADQQLAQIARGGCH